jgi:hypothetical protein
VSPGALSWPFPWEFRSGPAGSRTIQLASQGGNAISYTVSGDDSLGIEALSFDVDSTVPLNDVFVRAELADQSGALLARVVTGLGLSAGFVGQVTFAPNLPDSSTFRVAYPITQVQTGLWDVEAEPDSTLTGTALDVDARVTGGRILAFNVGGPSGEVFKPELVYSSQAVG